MKQLTVSQLDKCDLFKNIEALGENLTRKDHIEVISKKVSFDIRALKRVRGLIDLETAIEVYKL